MRTLSFVVLLLAACHDPQERGQNLETDEQAEGTCVPPEGDRLDPEWFQISCFQTAGSASAEVSSQQELEGHLTGIGCDATVQEDFIDFDTQRAVIFSQIGRISWVVDTGDSIAVGMEIYRGPAPGSQGIPVVILEASAKPITARTCQGSDGCISGGPCPPST